MDMTSQVFKDGHDKPSEIDMTQVFKDGHD